MQIVADDTSLFSVVHDIDSSEMILIMISRKLVNGIFSGQ